MGQHPRDREGRLLPDAGFPIGKEAPGRLERLRRFVNSANLESGADRLADVADAMDFLQAEGWQPWSVDAHGLERLRRTRDLLRALAVANLDGRRDAAPWRALVGVTAALGVAVREGSPILVGDGDVAGELVAIAVAASLDGSWPRLKACRNESCRWVVYDRTRSGSNEWCSMSA
ncbi:MAG TPA: CGNR zinc finger domain-containing protein, partial [Ilumatobacteraceae bacterium]